MGLVESQQMSMQREFEAFRRRARDGVDRYLTQAFSPYPDNEVCRVARYVSTGGGRRWRALVAIAGGAIFHRKPLRIVMPAACGVELAHAASLLLDDLPSMDNARERRGRPCAHLVFPQWAVDMAPVFLVTLAYHLTLSNPTVSYERRVRSALELSSAGLRMIRGQETDLTLQQRRGDSDWLMKCYQAKCGALFAAAAKVGAMHCGADDNHAPLLEDCGMNLGMAYQCLDDVADVIGKADQMGKRPGMDAGKPTAVDFWGVDGTRRLAAQFKERSLACLQPFGVEADLLRQIVHRADWAHL